MSQLVHRQRESFGEYIIEKARVRWFIDMGHDERNAWLNDELDYQTAVITHWELLENPLRIRVEYGYLPRHE